MAASCYFLRTWVRMNTISRQGNILDFQSYSQLISFSEGEREKREDNEKENVSIREKTCVSMFNIWGKENTDNKASLIVKEIRNT